MYRLQVRSYFICNLAPSYDFEISTELVVVHDEEVLVSSKPSTFKTSTITTLITSNSVKAYSYVPALDGFESLHGCTWTDDFYDD
jgi:hypothetical protein